MKLRMSVWDLRTYGWKELRWNGKQVCDEFRTHSDIYIRSGEMGRQDREGMRRLDVRYNCSYKCTLQFLTNSFGWDFLSVCSISKNNG